RLKSFFVLKNEIISIHFGGHEVIMKKVNDNTLHFYSSKIKISFFTIMSFLFLILAIMICFLGYQEEVYVLIPVSIFLIFLLGPLTFFLLKSIFTTKPYIILTDKELTINSALIKEIPIKREDVGSYVIKRQNFSTTVELILPDEDKYKARMSSVKQKINAAITMGGAYNTFSIGVNQVKKKDRDILYYLLDNIKKPGFNLEDEKSTKTNQTKDSFKLEDKITIKYFLQSYGISLLLAAFSLFILAIGDILTIIVSFVLFPFSKVLYDAIIGFKLDEKIKKQDSIIIHIYVLIYTVYLLLFLFSFFVAPFGILFMISRAIYWLFKKLKET